MTSPREGAFVVSVNVSVATGEPKSPVSEVVAVENRGFSGDAHAGSSHRQVSLLAVENVDAMRRRGADVSPGSFAENITTKGIVLPALPIGTHLRIGESIELEVTQIGKECHDRCAIYEQIGDCVMPREGIFTRVLAGGRIRPGDPMEVL